MLKILTVLVVFVVAIAVGDLICASGGDVKCHATCVASGTLGGRCSNEKNECECETEIDDEAAILKKAPVVKCELWFCQQYCEWIHFPVEHKAHCDDEKGCECIKM